MTISAPDIIKAAFCPNRRTLFPNSRIWVQSVDEDSFPAYDEDAPLDVLGIVDIGWSQFYQVPHAPAYQIAVALKVAVLTAGGTEDFCIGHGYRRFFRHDQFCDKNPSNLFRLSLIHISREKVFVSLDELETAIPAQLEALRQDLYQRALKNREARTWAATTMEEVKQLAQANTGYIKTMWCGDLACEMKMKEEAGLSSRCMPFAQEHLSDVCPCCGKPAKEMCIRDRLCIRPQGWS